MADLVRLPGPQPEKWEWQLRAACRGMDSSLFFHPFNEQMPDRQRRIDAAKAICGSCPAVAECRTHALTVQEPYGIWGGMSERDRAALLGVPIHAVSRTTIRPAAFRPDPSEPGAKASVCECRQRLTARVGGRAKPCPAPNIEFSTRTQMDDRFGMVRNLRTE